MASSRVDAADLHKLREYKPISCGFPGGFDQKYEQAQELGRGGFGVVRVVRKRRDGKEYAAKSIRKVLNIPSLSVDRQAAHLANIKREAAVLYRLRGTLNVVQIKEVLEDDEHVHIVMELCRGGELSHSLGKRHFSEKTVCSYMRAVLRTLAQCHSHRILHRDIKPGNFMLLNTDERSPLKAIDFGLAVFYDAGQLPRTDLGLEGTPWFLAPENLSSEFYPASDIWSAGVMAYQLLSGYMPFDDRRNRSNPALSQIWKAILTEEPDYNISALKDVSQQAKVFMALLLNKDPQKRPSAKDALKHPWLAGGSSADRTKGKPLQQTVVQRIQRFNHSNALKRTIFEMIAQELLIVYAANGATPDPTAHPGNTDDGAARQQSQAASPRPAHLKRPLSPGPAAEDGGGLAFRGPGGGAIEGPPLLGRMSAGSAHGGLEYYRSRGESVHGGMNALMAGRRGGSVHGGSNYWRIMRAAATAAKWHNRSVQGSHDYVRWVGRSEEERAEQRKAARLCLDTSAHGGSEYRRLVRVLSSAALHQDIDITGSSQHWRSAETSQHTASSDPVQPAAPASASVLPQQPPAALPCIMESHEPGSASQSDAEEQGRRGQRAYERFVVATGGDLSQTKSGGLDNSDGLPRTAMQEELQRQARSMGGGSISSGAALEQASSSAEQRPAAVSPAPGTIASPERPSSSAGGRKVTFSADTVQRADPPDSPQPSAMGMRELRDVMRTMNYTREAEAVSEEELAQGLASLGFRLDPSEMRALLQHMDEQRSGSVKKSAFLASQLDWPSLQSDYREQWLAAARKVFEGLDGGTSGLTTSKLMQVLRAKLPSAEVDYAVEDALVDAGYKDEEEIDFEGFMRIIRASSADSLDNLDQYDARLPKGLDSLHDGSLRSP